MGKRLFDFVFAALLLVMLSPLLAVIACAVAISLGRPIFFRQRRPGLHGRLFTLVKFRSMRDVTGDDGRSLSDEARLTRFGKLMRATSLDELPELWNVLRGDMSLVGPRPLLEEYLPLYSNVQARRHEVRPGITGWAQIHGRNTLDWEDRLRLDVWYVDNHSLLLDVRILLRTVSTVLSARGIHAPGAVTMPRFRGNRK